MRVRRDLGSREAAHLVADRDQRLVEAGIAEGGGALTLAISSTRRARFSGVVPWISARTEGVRNAA